MIIGGSMAEVQLRKSPEGVCGFGEAGKSIQVMDNMGYVTIPPR